MVIDSTILMVAGLLQLCEFMFVALSWFLQDWIGPHLIHPAWSVFEPIGRAAFLWAPSLIATALKCLMGVSALAGVPGFGGGFIRVGVTGSRLKRALLKDHRPS